MKSKTTGYLDVGDKRHDDRTTGQVPGIAAGGVDNRQQGLRGQIASKFARKWARPLDGIDPKCVGPFAHPDCLELFSRATEQTLSTFQLTARRPSHIDPPFSAKDFRIWGTGPTVVNAVFPAYQTLFAFTMPDSHRGVVVDLGQALDSEALFPLVSWRIRVGQEVLGEFRDIRSHVWSMASPTHLCDPIHLRGNEQFELQIAIIAPPLVPPINANWQVCGWHWPVRSESGDNSKSTITD